MKKNLSTRGATALLLLCLSVSALGADRAAAAHESLGFGDRIIRFILKLPKLFTPTTREDMPGMPKP
jgi:hypothetical protein